MVAGTRCDLANSLARFGELNGNGHDSQAAQGWKMPNNSPIFAIQLAKKSAIYFAKSQDADGKHGAVAVIALDACQGADFFGGEEFCFTGHGLC
jgi:hypothetical protein